MNVKLFLSLSLDRGSVNLDHRIMLFHVMCYFTSGVSKVASL